MTRRSLGFTVLRGLAVLPLSTAASPQAPPRAFPLRITYGFAL
jgi:hypothetical protein